MVLGGVEVDVIRDLERQVQVHLRHGVARRVRHIACRDHVGDLLAHANPAGSPLGHERVQCGLGENRVVEQLRQVDDLVADAHPDSALAAGGREDPVRQIGDAEERM
jgi:hypothetical protein